MEDINILTTREKEILALIVEGKSNPEIARALIFNNLNSYGKGSY